MSQQIKIFDTTLRDGEQSPGCSMNLNEKLKMARQLERLRVDIIEAGFAIASPGDFESVAAIAQTIKDCTVASLSRLVKKDIDASAEALKNAVSPRIHTFIATSDLHMRYKLKMKPEDVLSQIDELVAYARNLCPDVEFSAEDASRSDRDFLCRALERAIRAGASTVNIPDTVGYATPEEMFDLISYIKNNVPNIDKATISVHNHNDLGLGVATSLASIKAGATPGGMHGKRHRRAGGQCGAGGDRYGPQNPAGISSTCTTRIDTTADLPFLPTRLARIIGQAYPQQQGHRRGERLRCMNPASTSTAFSPNGSTYEIMTPGVDRHQ